MNTKRKKLYEGKAKILYEGPEPGTLIQYFKDDATAFNAQKKATLEGKGVINNQISEFIMTRLNGIGVTNHFIKRLNLREQLIREVEIIPLEVVCRNIVAGSLSQRLGIEEGTQLPRSIIEFYYKKDELGDPMVTEEHITAFNWASTQELDDILAMTVRVNDYLCGMFGAVGITLVDFKIEFGRIWENDFARVILADEISPDSCRLWDTASGEKLDKDRFRRDMGGEVEAYQEVARRLGLEEVESDLVYCSRSGPPTQPWLEPDVNDHLAVLKERGVEHVILAPIGFVLPMSVGAILMSASTVVVALNAQLLRRLDLRPEATVAAVRNRR